MAKLIVLSGVPGSGKSFFSQRFKELRKGHVYIVSSDDIRDKVAGNQQDLSQDKLVWKLFYGLTRVFGMDEEGTVILDATNSICKYRTSIVEPFRKLFQEIDLVAFDIDKDLVRKQNRERPFPVPDDVLEMLIEKYEGPNEIDCRFFDNIHIIKDHNINPIIDLL